jgi:hypothetical protein
VLGVVFLSTPLIAAQSNVSTAPTVVKKKTQRHPTAKDLKRLEEVRRHNVIFDNYHTGGISPFDKVYLEPRKGK